MVPRISVVIPTREVRPLPLPAGADELLVVGGAGLSRARNHGARVARGDLVVFLDEDVTLEGSLEVLNRRPLSETWWTARFETDTQDDYTRNVCATLSAFGAMGRWNASIGPFNAVRRHVFLATGGYRVDRIHEDSDFARRMHQAGFRLRQLPITVHVHRRFSKFGEIWAHGGGRGGTGPMPWLRIRPQSSSLVSQRNNAARPTIATRPTPTATHGMLEGG